MTWVELPRAAATSPQQLSPSQGVFCVICRWIPQTIVRDSKADAAMQYMHVLVLTSVNIHSMKFVRVLNHFANVLHVSRWSDKSASKRRRRNLRLWARNTRELVLALKLPFVISWCGTSRGCSVRGVVFSQSWTCTPCVRADCVRTEERMHTAVLQIAGLRVHRCVCTTCVCIFSLTVASGSTSRGALCARVIRCFCNNKKISPAVDRAADGGFRNTRRPRGPIIRLCFTRVSDRISQRSHLLTAGTCLDGARCESVTSLQIVAFELVGMIRVLYSSGSTFTDW